MAKILVISSHFWCTLILDLSLTKIFMYPYSWRKCTAICCGKFHLFPSGMLIFSFHTYLAVGRGGVQQFSGDCTIPFSCYMLIPITLQLKIKSPTASIIYGTNCLANFLGRGTFWRIRYSYRYYLNFQFAFFQTYLKTF